MTAPARPAPSRGLLVEYFTLAEASAEGEKLGAARRKEIQDALAVGRQRGEAAETLWSNGHTADGLRLALTSLEDTLEAATRLAGPQPEAPVVESVVAESAVAESAVAESEAVDAKDLAATESASDAASESPAPVEPPTVEKPARAPEPWRAALASRGVRASAIERVSQALAEARATKLPTLDADVSPALSELFPRVMAARHTVDSAVTPAAWSPQEIQWTRVRRTAGAALALVASIVGIYFAVHEPEGTFTSASEVWAESPTFSADMAVDGRPETSWLLPDRATGWLEVRTSPSRRVERVVLTNTSNAPAHDRGTSDYRLEIYAHGELARSIDGRFDWSVDPQPVTHEIGMDDVDRVRFVVRAYHHTGGGLAEMSIQ